MASITFLGTGSAVTNADHDNVHLLVQSGQQTLLVDCPSNPIPALKRRGVDLTYSLRHLVLTHFHADHVSALALMLQTAWLLGRKDGLPVYGLDFTLMRAEKLMELFQSNEWPGMFPVQFTRVPESEQHLAIDTPDLRVLTSPVRHLIPNIGIRMEFPEVNKAVVYSSDTRPCREMVALAQGADLLIHEASGEYQGHTSAAQAGEIARQAGVKALRLIHYPTWESAPTSLVEEAGRTVGGDVDLARDGEEIEL